MESRDQAIVKASRIGIAVNVALSAGKAAAGLLSHSVAITTDALNNLTDALSAIITLIGARAAGKEPDKQHPFGHGRIEYVSAAAVAVLILFTGVSALRESVVRILHPADADYDALALSVMAISIAVKLVLGRYCRAKGKAIDSGALHASGTDALFDAAVSGSILVGALIRLVWDVSIDGWLGAGISLLIFKSGIDVLRDGLNSIIGERVPAEISKELREEISAFPAVEDVCDLVLHRYGPEQLIGSVYIVLPENMTVREADAVCREISECIEERHGIPLTVAVYAANTPDEISDAMRAELLRLTDQYPEILQVHGFFVDLDTRVVSFHLTVDFSCQDPDQIVVVLQDSMRSRFPGYAFSATVDRDICD